MILTSVSNWMAQAKPCGGFIRSSSSHGATAAPLPGMSPAITVPFARARKNNILLIREDISKKCEPYPSQNKDQNKAAQLFIRRKSARRFFWYHMMVSESANQSMRIAFECRTAYVVGPQCTLRPRTKTKKLKLGMMKNGNHVFDRWLHAKPNSQLAEAET